MKTLFILLTAITIIAVSTDANSADTNTTVSSTVVTDKAPPTANSPSVVAGHSLVTPVPFIQPTSGTLIAADKNKYASLN